MANAKQCDICGKFYAAHKKRSNRYRYSDTNFIQLVNCDYNLNDLDDESAHLETCLECFTAVEAFINQLRNRPPITTT